MSMFKFKLSGCILVLFALMILPAIGAEDKIVKPKYVFLFIGDGMSVPQRMMVQEYSQRTRQKGLFINGMPIQIPTITRSANKFVTDSAASGTAIACGEKTNNGVIGMASDKKRKLESTAEVARDNGKKVAIITSVTINHATPASFYGHRPYRGQYYDLGLDLIAAKFDFYGGGGVAGANGKNGQTSIYELAEKAGYTVCRTDDEVRKFKPGQGRVLALCSPGAMPFALDRNPDNLRLKDIVKLGIEHCDNPNGFFMMCEGGAIDWFGHANDAAGVMTEVLELDEAVKVAYEFYLKHPKETLIVVTGDHETGGLSLGFAGTGYQSNIELLAAQKCTSYKLPEVFAAPGANGRTVTWDEMKKVITGICGLEFAGLNKEQPGTLKLTPNDESVLRKAFDKQYPNGKLTANKKLHKVLPVAVLRIFNNKAGVAWSTGGHSAAPVNTSCLGQGSEIFRKIDVMDNTDIAKKLKSLLRK